MKRLTLLLRKLILAQFFLFLFFPTEAQEDFRNSIYVELGGNAGIYSVNYERLFSKQVPVKVGISLLPEDARVTVMSGKYFGKYAHYFEIMAGLTYGVEREAELSTNYHYVFLSVFIGYRYQKPHSRFLFRAGIIPFFSEYSRLSGGISAGYRFN